MMELASRQIHLDFHTSPLIDDVAVEFDPVQFARTLAAAHVQSVTLFAKCHHGMCYYPTKTGTQHPALRGRDLLGEQMAALHREGIRCPIYTTVAWEEDVAQRYPQWRQLRADGGFARVETSPDGVTKQPGGWRFNNFLHPEYQDYIEQHAQELLERYGRDFDGIFFDILFFDDQACWSPESIRFRERHGLCDHDTRTQRRFEALAQESFVERFTQLVQGARPDATVFYNSTNRPTLSATDGMRRRQRFMTHWEVESLPSGFWGYHHFPRVARLISHWKKPWLGMTGRFQKMWGDFGGIKPKAALEFECFRSQALGGANSIGDQLPPRGKLDRVAYDLIGPVYAECKRAEPFYADSWAIPEIGILLPEPISGNSTEADLSLEGAVQLCEEMHYDSAVIDDSANLGQFKLLVLPDTVLVTSELAQALAAYSGGGGKVILSYRSGITGDGAWVMQVPMLKMHGENDIFPAYWRCSSALSKELAGSDRVVYQPGMNIEALGSVQILAHRVLPYFKRTDYSFCSHYQAPPRAVADRFPSIVGNEEFVYFAEPIFREYRTCANTAIREAWRACVHRLIGPELVGHGLSPTITVYPRRQLNDLLLTLLHYIPTRRSLEVDVIDAPLSFADQRLRLPSHIQEVHVFGEEMVLTRDSSGAFVLPSRNGRLLLRVKNFFKSDQAG